MLCIRTLTLAASLTLLAAAVPTEPCHRVTLHLYSAASDATIEEELIARSTPSNPQFRQHLSIAELTQLVRAEDHVLSTILRSHPRAVVSVTRDSVVIPYCGAPTVLSVTKHRTHIDASSVVEPQVAPYVRLAYIALPSTGTKQRRVASQGQFPGVNQSPNTIRRRYNIPNTTLPSGSGANATIPGQAVAEFEGEQFYYSNMVSFGQRYGGIEVNVSILGPNNGGYFGEGNMDLEYIMALAQGAPTWWVELNEFDMTAWTERFLTAKPLPSVASISWGSGSSGFQLSDMESDTMHFKKLGLLGVSVLAAAGDVGTGSTGFFSCGTFDSNWPASSPFVTAVGATYSNSSVGGVEAAWSGSGGGFSACFNRPSWQATAVEAYLSSTAITLPPQQFWNRTGRAVPDVAAVGTNFEVYSYGWGTETGTSAATPTFASIITRINAERSANGKPTLGFLNPALYQLGKVGFDVLLGDNQNAACPAGFEATVGWDAVSGLGTPEYTFLLNNL